VQSGSVDVFPELDLPKVATLGVGSFFGESSTLTGQSINSYIMAAEALSCYVLREVGSQACVAYDVCAHLF